jgi:hypothetical protein
MKKFYKRAIKAQARSLEKLLKDIKSIRKLRKCRFGADYVYTRKERSEVLRNNGNNYRPTELPKLIGGMSDCQKAEIMRALRRYVVKHEFGFDSEHIRENNGKQYRLYGNLHSTKQFLCDLLIKKEVHFALLNHGGEEPLYMFYVAPKFDNVFRWDECKRTKAEALDKYPLEKYRWKQVDL